MAAKQVHYAEPQEVKRARYKTVSMAHDDNTEVEPQAGADGTEVSQQVYAVVWGVERPGSVVQVELKAQQSELPHSLYSAGSPAQTPADADECCIHQECFMERVWIKQASSLS